MAEMTTYTAAQDIFDLSGVNSVVTGAARGIGRAAAVALAQRGAFCTLFDLSEEAMSETADEVRRVGGNCQIVRGDVTVDDDLARLTAAAGADQISVLINCAGIVRRTPVDTFSLDDMELMWRVNARGTAAVVQKFLPGMIAAGRGKIVNIGSLGSVTGLMNRTAYASSKGAVALYTKSLALELGPHGICVNAIAPGYIETDMTRSWLYDDAQRSRQLLDRIPMGRFGRTHELGGLFVFLSSAASDYVTGQVILADGGWMTS